MFEKFGYGYAKVMEYINSNTNKFTCAAWKNTWIITCIA